MNEELDSTLKKFQVNLRCYARSAEHLQRTLTRLEIQIRHCREILKQQTEVQIPEAADSGQKE